MKAKSFLITLTLLLAVGISFFFLPSCAKLKEATTLKVKYDLPDTYFTIDSSALLKSEKVLFTQSFSANIDSIIGSNSGLLNNVSFYQLRVSILSPAWVTLNWLTSARATITPEGGAPIEIATTTTIDNAARTVDFQIKDLDLASKITKPYVLTIYGNLSAPVPVESIDLLFESGIEVSISPF
jgi:hypothetical protein